MTSFSNSLCASSTCCTLPITCVQYHNFLKGTPFRPPGCQRCGTLKFLCQWKAHSCFLSAFLIGLWPQGATCSKGDPVDGRPWFNEALRLRWKYCVKCGMSEFYAEGGTLGREMGSYARRNRWYGKCVILWLDDNLIRRSHRQCQESQLGSRECDLIRLGWSDWLKRISMFRWQCIQNCQLCTYTIWFPYMYSASFATSLSGYRRLLFFSMYVGFISQQSQVGYVQSDLFCWNLKA